MAGGEEVEIIVIDDGSTDRTGEIADCYAEKYPETVRAVHQKNGGHGAGVNKGLSLAAGEYFKVVDSDDWLDEEALKKLLTEIRKRKRQGALADLIICNYLYDHLYEGKQKRMGYENVFRDGKVCTWDTIGKFHPSQYLVMHAQICRTEVLQRSGVRLPRHTFYVDNLFANQPLPFVKTILYLDLDLYHYFLGREDQSVNEQVLMKRIDQQILVTAILHPLSLPRFRPTDSGYKNGFRVCGFEASTEGTSKTGGLSGAESVNHDVDFFHSSFTDRNGRGNGKKKRTVGVYEKKRKRSLSEASLRDRERFYLSAWKSRDGTYTGRLSPGKTVLSF